MTVASVRPTIKQKPAHPVLLLQAFLKRDWFLALSYRLPFIVDLFQSVLSVTFLFFLARVVGHKIATSSGLQVPYFGFAVIGTLMIGILTVSLASFSKRIRIDQMTGTLEVLFSMPVRPWLVVMASATYQVVYALITSGITLALAFWFGMRFHVTAMSAVVAVVDFIAALVVFGCLGMGLAAFVMVFKRGETVTALLVGALGLVGGVLYPVSSLSTPLRHLADVIPFTWALNAMRDALLGGHADYYQLTKVGVAALVLCPLSLWVFNVALNHAKKLGAVGQY
jgi:ABC-2 type transport system permease protein